MTKELFVETVDLLKEQMDLDSKRADQISEMFNCHSACYDNKLAEQVIRLLSDATGAPILTEFFLGDMTDIGYFVHELDFGKKWEPGYIKDTNGNDIKLQTASDLWEHLQSVLNKDQGVQGSDTTEAK